MIRRSRRQKLVAEINITPFTDVILVLLVIFMITTPLISQLNIKIRLPEAKSGEGAQAARASQATITVTNEGLVYLEEKIVTKKELRDKLTALYVNNPDMSVTLRSDRLVRFKDIVGVLDPLTDIGITKLNIAATAEQ